MTGEVIAVTGASGAIGQQLVERLRANGFQVVGLCRNPPQDAGFDIKWHPFALSDAAEVMAEKLRGVDQVVHLAAIIPGKVPSNEGDASLWNVNVLGTQRLIEAMAMAGAKRLVLTGTANVYEPDQAEASESSAFGPRSRVLYLASKAAQEWLAASMCNSSGIDCAILRISSVIGDGRGIIDRLALDLAAGQQVHIEDGAAFGADFIDCDDVCQGLLLAVEAKLNGAYNLSSGKRTELLDIVLELAQNLGRGPEAVQMVHADRAPDTGFPAINSDRLRSYGFAPKSLSDVLARIAADAKTQTEAAK
jgi:nucleoside-diphosphate-sugar epimerase